MHADGQYTSLHIGKIPSSLKILIEHSQEGAVLQKQQHCMQLYSTVNVPTVVALCSNGETPHWQLEESIHFLEVCS